MEEFRGNLKESVDLYAKQVAKLTSIIKKVESENIDLKNEIASITRLLKSQIHDLNKFEKDSIERSNRCLREKNHLEEGFSRLQDVVFSLRDSLVLETSGLKNSINGIFQDVRRNYLKSVSDNEKLKEEILSLPSEAEKVKGELLKTLSSASIDNAGIMKELAIVKRGLFVQEKMNEYFHIQLDRLKNKGVAS